MFWSALRPLLAEGSEALRELDDIREGFAAAMQQQLEAMWARKLGLAAYDDPLMHELLQLMASSGVDYTMLFRRLAEIAGHGPDDGGSDNPAALAALRTSFYRPSSEELETRWSRWLQHWRERIARHGDPQETSAAMQRVNPAITWREWLIAPAYEQAAQGETTLIRELQAVFSDPYALPPGELAARYDRLRPREFFQAGGISHFSCSS
jgi:uncharacterized protein YdiU (UPF0061 family)